MTREEVIEFAEQLQKARCDYPFEGDFFSAVLRRTDNNKWFGIILKAPDSFYKGGAVVLNVKCPPDLIEFLCAGRKGILPAYHMNKKHWISVLLDGTVPEEDIKQLLMLSYDLTGGKQQGR